LREEIVRKDTIISELVAENLALKKEWDIRPRGHIRSKDVMDEIVQTAGRYKGYGISIREYCEAIGISQSRYYTIAKATQEQLSPKAKKKVSMSWNALSEEEREAVIAYAIGHPQYYHREMAYRMIDENIVYTSPSTVYRILKKHGLIRENEQKKRYGWVHTNPSINTNGECDHRAMAQDI